MNNQKVNIPKPCAYGWDRMTVRPDAKGRHCAACDKIVVDFTQMTTSQVVSYLEKYKGTRVCGHFKTINTTAATWYQKPLLKIYDRFEQSRASAFFKSVGLFFMGSLLALAGCDTRTDGDIVVPEITSDTIQCSDSSKAKNDSVQLIKTEGSKGN